jgi:UrcA family protein
MTTESKTNQALRPAQIVDAFPPAQTVDAERRQQRRASASAAFLAMSVLLAVCVTPVEALAQSRSARVALGDLDLSTPQGMATARARMHQAARRLCSQLDDFEDLGRQPAYVKCIDDTLAAALRQVSDSGLASIQKSEWTKGAAR